MAASLFDVDSGKSKLMVDGIPVQLHDYHGMTSG